MDQVTILFQFGKFEQAIDEIDNLLIEVDRGSEKFIELNKLKSRLYYHLGRTDQAEYFMKEVSEFVNDTEVLAYLSIFKFGLGEVDVGRQLLEQVELSDLTKDQVDVEKAIEDIRGLSTYHYAKGLILEFEGRIEEAKQEFLESLTFREMLDDQYESNILYYKLATMERQVGKLHAARKYLEQSLQISQRLELLKETATTSTLIGQHALMQTDYDEAKIYLSDGVQFWKEHGSPFGIVWALAELAIVNYLSGNYSKALDEYREILDHSRDIMPPFYMSGHLVNAIRFAIRSGDVDLASSLLGELQQISEDEDNDLINDRLELAKLLLKQHTSRIGKKLSDIKAFDHLNSQSREFIISYLSLIESIKLLILEYKITENQVFKEEIQDEADERIDQLLDYIHLQMGISFELHSAVLREQLEILDNPRDKMETLMEILNEKTDTSIFAIDQNQDHFIGSVEYEMSDFAFNKEFQSIPTLKVLLYLLPRPSASFRELQDGTDLSAGHLSGKCSKLEELGLITKDKTFVEEKLTTIYSITSNGYIQLKSYMQRLNSYLDQIFR